MISVVMPTMWRSDRTEGLLNSLSDTDCVSEIIIIDNDRDQRPDISFPKKSVILDQDENIFVNPAWNLGVKESKEDYLCIINDDLSMNCKNSFPIMEELLEHIPCIGVHSSSYSYEEDDVLMVRGHDIGRGWGCCMFLDKSKWVDIPDNLKIWYGDNWIVANYKECASIVMPIKTEMSTTSNSKELNEVIERDRKEWNKIKQNELTGN
jgi:hypothetical protein